MKTKKTHTSPSFKDRLRRLAPLFTGLAVLAALLVSPSVASAQTPANILIDPGAESSTTASATFAGWTIWGGGGDYVGNATDPGVAAYDGVNYFKIYGNYGGSANNYSGFFQTFGASPGQVFSANGWVYQNPSDDFTPGDTNRAYLEVQFKDINGVILADYQSTMVTSNSLTGSWYNLQVTNEVSPTAGMATNMVAPANTVQVEYDVVFNLIGYGGGSTYWDDLALLSTAPPAPFVTNMVPANVILATNQTFTFGAVAQSGNITNIQVTIIAGSGLVNPTTNIVTYTNASAHLTLTGLGTPTVSGSVALSSNATYSITVLAIDSNDGIATANAAFDTFQPVVLWEAEDFNFGGGDTTNTPPDGGVDLYAGLVGTPSIDENWITSSSQSYTYRTTDKVSMGAAGEIPRQKFLNAIADGSNTNATDYEVGYNTTGDWEDYTRTFPAGSYNIYARMATVGAANQISLAMVGGNLASGAQTTTNLGYCNVTDNNWNGYLYCPLVDSFGNLVTVPLSGTQTIRSTVSGGGPNINFYMIVPATGSPYPALINSYPTGAHPFEPTNKFSFTVGPANGSPISANAISLTLNGVNVTSQLAISAGASNQWTASVPISPSTIYAAVINVTNSTKLSSTYAINFDTFSQTNFMWEAEDFDFNGGQFIDNPMPSFDPTIVDGGLLEPNSYCGFPEGNSANSDIPGIDDGWINVAGQTTVYRVSTVSTQVASDYLRQKFLDAQTTLSDPNIADVNIGYWTAGSWLNYTRTYPTGAFYVYGRMAGAAPSWSGTTFAVVTNGVGTTTQQTNMLGSFSDPNAVGYQTWHWIELLTNGVPAVVSLNGVSTFTITSGGNVNANYYMLVPAPAVAGAITLTVALVSNQPAITFPTTVGYNYTLYYKNNLTDATWTSLTSVAGDGATHTLTDTTATGVAHRFYMVQ